MADEEEDDYLSMSFGEPAKPAKETPLQRTARLKRERADRANMPSKAELAARAETARETGLATKLDASTNKGAQLMAKMGFKGGALGAADNQGRENPIEVLMRDGRGGIGMESEKKRKVKEAFEAQELVQKKAKVDADDYRARNRQEAEDRRAEGQWWGAMKILEGLAESDSEQSSDNKKQPSLRSINLLYRPLVKSRRDAEQRKLDMKAIFQDRPKLGSHEDPEMDDDDKLAVIDDTFEDHSEDIELEEYEAQPPAEKLDKVVDHLRTTYHYCFWCKYRYEDASMEGCPGTSEDEHG